MWALGSTWKSKLTVLFFIRVTCLFFFPKGKTEGTCPFNLPHFHVYPFFLHLGSYRLLLVAWFWYKYQNICTMSCLYTTLPDRLSQDVPCAELCLVMNIIDLENLNTHFITLLPWNLKMLRTYWIKYQDCQTTICSKMLMLILNPINFLPHPYTHPLIVQITKYQGNLEHG